MIIIVVQIIMNIVKTHCVMAKSDKNMIIVWLTIYVLLHSESKAELYQLHSDELICSNQASFICKYGDGPSVRWEIMRTSNRHFSRFSFNTEYHSSNHIMTRVLDYSTITAILLFENYTHYITSLTFPANWNAWIHCKTQSSSYHYQNYSTYIPVKLDLISNGFVFGLNKFIAKWMPNTLVNVSGSRLTVSPELKPCGITELLTNGSPILLNIENNTLYSFNLSYPTCTDRIKSNFNFGRCPLLDLSSPLFVMQYTIYTDGRILATINCSLPQRQKYYEIECNEEWNTSKIISCINSIEAIGTNENYEYITMKPTTNEISVVDITESVTINYLMEAYVLIGSVAGSSLFTLIIGIVIGCLCGIKCRRRVQRERTIIAETCMAVNPMDGRIYEEISCHKKQVKIGCSDNVAYGQVGR